ncbi:MAG: RNA-binding domain-containing protein [Thermoplasmatota archaeon]
MEIHVEAPVTATEAPGRVVEAIRTVFPDASLTVSDDRVTGEAQTLDTLKELLAQFQILDTARMLLHRRIDDGRLCFRLNKQAAYAGTVNFSEVGHPLGDITVTITDGDLPGLVDWLTETE